MRFDDGMSHAGHQHRLECLLPAQAGDDGARSSQREQRRGCGREPLWAAKQRVDEVRERRNDDEGDRKMDHERMEIRGPGRE